MRRLRRTTVQAVIVFTIMLLVMAGVGVGVFYITTEKLTEKYGEKVGILEDEIQNATRDYYTAAADIRRGDILTEHNMQKVRGYVSLPPSYLATGDDIGKTARIDIGTEEIIMLSMVSEENVGENLREQEYNIFHLASNIVSGDTVDIRIYFPNGENYIVLSKKDLKKVNLAGADCFLWLDEEETLLLSSAIVDAYMNPGTTLYTARYVEPSIQEASIVTYVPSENVAGLMERDPNIVDIAKINLNREIRKAMESTLWGRNSSTDGGSGLEDLYNDGKEEGFEEFLHGNAGQDEAVLPDMNETVYPSDSVATGGAVGAGEEGGFWSGGDDDAQN